MSSTRQRGILGGSAVAFRTAGPLVALPSSACAARGALVREPVAPEADDWIARVDRDTAADPRRPALSESAQTAVSAPDDADDADNAPASRGDGRLRRAHSRSFAGQPMMARHAPVSARPVV